MKKTLLKVVTVIAAFCMLASVSACAGERVASYTRNYDINGIKATETFTFNAKGDIIYQITENIKLDLNSNLSDLSEEETISIKDYFKTSITDEFSEIEGVNCTDDLTDGIYTINAVIPAEKEILSVVAEKGLLEFTGNSSRLSLTVTEKSLKENGYEKTEQ